MRIIIIIKNRKNEKFKVQQTNQMGALCHSRMQRRWPAGIVNVFVCVSILLNLFSLFLNWIKNRINRDPSAITQDNNKRNVHVVHFTNKPAPLPPLSLQTRATHNEWTNFFFLEMKIYDENIFVVLFVVLFVTSNVCARLRMCEWLLLIT